jgi:hypothetical protein
LRHRACRSGGEDSIGENVQQPTVQPRRVAFSRARQDASGLRFGGGDFGGEAAVQHRSPIDKPRLGECRKATEMNRAAPDFDVDAPAVSFAPSTDRVEHKPAILPLLGVGCPPAIVGTVARFVIDAIERIGWRWSKPHVGEERHEIMPPAVAHADATAAVASKTGMLRAVAPPVHLIPSDVFKSRPLAPLS